MPQFTSPTGASPYHRRLGAVALGRFVLAAVVKQRIDVVQAPARVAVVRDAVVRYLLAEIRLHDVDARLEQRAVFVAPERERFRIREIDDRRRRQRRQHVPEGRRRGVDVPVENIRLAIRFPAQKESALGEFRIARAFDRYIGVESHEHAQAEGANRREHRLRIGIAAFVQRKSKRVRISHAARPSSVSTSHGTPCSRNAAATPIASSGDA